MTANLQTLHDILQHTEGAKPALTRLHVESRPATTPAEVRAAIAAFGAANGWLCYTDEVAVVRDGGDLRQGIILSGELATDTRTLHIRQDETGWRLVTLTEGEGEDCLALDQRHIGTPKLGNGQTLNYRIYWRQQVSPVCPDAAALTPWVGRFVGFGTGGEK